MQRGAREMAQAAAWEKIKWIWEVAVLRVAGSTRAGTALTLTPLMLAGVFSVEACTCTARRPARGCEGANGEGAQQ